MVKVLRRIFSINYMLKSKQIVSELPRTEEVYKLTFKTAWPSALETFLVGLIGLIDTIMVGAIEGGDLGTRAIAAVGITGQPRMILLTFVFSLNVGVTAVVARRKGENDRERANETLAQGLMLCFFIVIVMGSLGLIFAEQFMKLAGAADDIIEFATDYFRITTVGFMFSGLGMVINASQRGIGNTRISMHTNIVANLVNLVFNYLLINGHFGFPELQVRGAAIATVLGNFVMFMMCIIKVTRKGDDENANFLKLTFSRKTFRFTSDTIKSIANVSSSAFAEQIFMRIGFFSFARTVADLGTVALSTHHMCMNILNISFTFGDGLGIASSSLVGRSLGAKRPDMAIIYGKVSQRMALMVSSVLFFVFVFGRYFLIGLFTVDPDIIKTGALIMMVIALISPLQTSQVVISGSLRGAGDTKFVAFTSFFGIAIMRPVAAWFLCYGMSWGLIGAWISILFDQMLRLGVNSWRFTQGEWTKKKV